MPISAAAQGRVERAFPVDLTRDPVVDRAVGRLANRPHVAPSECERRGVDDRFVTEVELPHAPGFVHVEPVAAGTEHRHPPALALAEVVEHPERVRERLRIADRVTRHEPDAAHVAVRDGRAPVRREHVVLVVAQRERVERVTVGPVHEVAHALTRQRVGDRAFGDRREHDEQQEQHARDPDDRDRRGEPLPEAAVHLQAAAEADESRRDILDRVGDRQRLPDGAAPEQQAREAVREHEADDDGDRARDRMQPRGRDRNREELSPAHERDRGDGRDDRLFDVEALDDVGDGRHREEDERHPVRELAAVHEPAADEQQREADERSRAGGGLAHGRRDVTGDQLEAMVDRGCQRRADVDETDCGDEAAEQPRPRAGVDAGSRHRMSQTDLRTSARDQPRCSDGTALLLSASIGRSRGSEEAFRWRRR